MEWRGGNADSGSMSAAADFIPREDDALLAYAQQFGGEAYSWWSAQGIDNAEAFAVFGLTTEYQAALEGNVAAQNAARAAKQSKDAARARLVSQIRLVARQLQGQPQMDNASRALIGITVRQGRTGETPVPSSAPIAHVAQIERLRHVVAFTDSATPTRMAKPKGAWCCEVRLKLVASDESAPIDPATMQPLALATDGKVIADFELTHKGKQAVYVMRWVNAKGAGGPWSEEVRAMVAA